MYISKQSEVYSMVREKGLNLEEMKTPLISFWLIRSKKMAAREELYGGAHWFILPIGLLAVVFARTHSYSSICSAWQMGGHEREICILKPLKYRQTGAIYLPVMNAFWQVQFILYNIYGYPK